MRTKVVHPHGAHPSRKGKSVHHGPVDVEKEKEITENLDQLISTLGVAFGRRTRTAFMRGSTLAVTRSSGLNLSEPCGMTTMVLLSK
jgi:hypothetical protein